MTPSRGLIHGKAPPDRVPIIASMSRQSDQISSAANQGSRERGMVAIVAALARELHPQRSRFIEVGASSRIEQDLGIDSLARTELVLRIERAFRVRLSAQAIGEAETVHDLAQALDRALPAQRRIGVEMSAAALPAVPAATKALTLIDVLEWHVARHPDRTHLTVLNSRPGLAAWGAACSCATSSPKTAWPMLPTGVDFFVAFLVGKRRLKLGERTRPRHSVNMTQKTPAGQPGFSFDQH